MDLSQSSGVARMLLKYLEKALCSFSTVLPFISHVMLNLMPPLEKHGLYLDLKGIINIHFSMFREISDLRYSGSLHTPLSFVGLNSSSLRSEVDQPITSKVFSTIFWQISTSSSK